MFIIKKRKIVKWSKNETCFGALEQVLFETNPSNQSLFTMRKLLSFTIVVFSLFYTQVVCSQEWENLKEYKKTTGNNILKQGCWLKKDRNKNSETWKKANAYNLNVENGNLKYKTIRQIRDFYGWFDVERKRIGHEINGVGVAALVAGQMSNFDSYFIRTFIVRNKKVVWFGNEGSKRVFAFAFPLLKEVYFSNHLIKGKEAKNWDIENGKIEQCQIVAPIYNELNSNEIQKLERIAKGKGIYNLGVKNKLKFEGDITDCKVRYEHAFTKLYTYYLEMEI